MAPSSSAALALAVDDDPVWAAALAAPPCTEPLSAEQLAAFEEAIEDVRTGRVRTVGHAEVLASLEQMRRDQGE